VGGGEVDNFPEFMRNPANRIASDSQYTSGIEGYVFDGADGSQIAHWTHPESVAVIKSAEHVHDYDEYMVVVQGKYTVVMGRKRVVLAAGGEYLIPSGTPHRGEAVGGTRTIHAFGGRRAERVGKRRPTSAVRLK
jgi:mannose-6-phosphate isomerase-like protein (cupin superfamily)